MFYQVLVKRPDGRWISRGSSDSSQQSVISKLQQAGREDLEVLLLFSRNIVDLSNATARVERGEAPPIGIPIPTTVEDLTRWELEAGPGADHDEPYRFTLPHTAAERRAWLDLAKRRWDGPTDGAAE